MTDYALSARGIIVSSWARTESLHATPSVTIVPQGTPL